MFARFQKYVYICTQIVTSGRSYGGFGGWRSALRAADLREENEV